MTPKIIEQPTLGQQPIVLGGLYSAVHNQYLPVMKLWTSEEINKYKETIFHPKQFSKWTSEQSLREKEELFGLHLGGSLSVDLNTAAVKAKGSFDYISHQKVSFIIKWLYFVVLKNLTF